MFNFLFHNKKTHRKLFFQTEMHCHLVPGIDDGQTTPAGGADLVEREAQWGIQRIFCTPHITQDTFENTPKVIADAFSLLQQEVSARNLEVKLDFSAEHRLDAFFLPSWRKAPFGHSRITFCLSRIRLYRRHGTLTTDFSI